VADLGGEVLHRRGDDAERGEERRVAVARDDLGRDGFRLEPQHLGDMRLDPGIDGGIGADRAGDGAGGDLGAGGQQPVAVALEGGPVAGQLQPECRGLGMDAVAAADGQRMGMFQRTLADRRDDRVQVLQQQVGRLGQLHRQRGVQHIGAGHALMQEARFRADMFGDIGQEGDDVVLRLLLDLVDPVGVERAALPDRLGRFLGYGAQFGHRIAGMGLDLEPDPVTVPRFPDVGHLGPAIARDHL